MLQPTCWTISGTTLSRVPKNAHAILPNTSNVPLDLSCVAIASRDFMIGLSSVYCFTNSHFDSLKFEIIPFVQPFANLIKGAHSKARRTY